MKQKFGLWDMIELTDGEPMTPFTLIQESDNFNELFEVYLGEKRTLCISDNEGHLLVDGSRWIYERDGEKIYRRQFGNYSQRELI